MEEEAAKAASLQRRVDWFEAAAGADALALPRFIPYADFLFFRAALTSACAERDALHLALGHAQTALNNARRIWTPCGPSCLRCMSRVQGGSLVQARAAGQCCNLSGRKGSLRFAFVCAVLLLTAFAAFLSIAPSIMSKFFKDTSRVAHESVHWTALQVFRVNHIFRELSGPDIGIDGEIELMQPGPSDAKRNKQFVSRHLFVKVQLKASSTPGKFTFTADRTNCEDWAAYGDYIPLIGIVYNSVSQEAVWINLSRFARHFLLLLSKSATHSVSPTNPFISATVDAALIPLAEQWQRIPSLHSQLKRLWMLEEDEPMPAIDELCAGFFDDLPTPAMDAVDATVTAWLAEFAVVPASILAFDGSVVGVVTLQTYLYGQFVLLPRAIFRQAPLFSSAQTAMLIYRLFDLEYYSPWLEMLAYSSHRYRSEYTPYLLGLEPHTSKGFANLMREGKFGSPLFRSGSPLMRMYYEESDYVPPVNIDDDFAFNHDSPTSLSPQLEAYLRDRD